MIAIVFSATPHPKVYDTEKYQLCMKSRILPNHPETHPMTIALLLYGSRSCPRLQPHILGARGRTPLHAAAWGSRAAVVEQLISLGATVDAADDKGRGLGGVFELFWE